MGRRIIITGVNRPVTQPWGTTRMYWLLENYLVKNAGFEFYRSLSREGVINNPRPLPKDTEIIYIHFAMHMHDVKAVMGYISQCPNASVVFVPGGDRRMWDKDRGVLKPFLDRVSFIFDNQKDSWPLSPNFEEAWPPYVDKHIFLPNCIAPEDEWFRWGYNENPKPKCILSGRVGGRYELRNQVLGALVNDRELVQYVDVLRHPDYGTFLVHCGKLEKQLKKAGKLSEVDMLALNALRAYKQVGPLNMGNENVVGWGYQRLLSDYLCGLAVDGSRVNTSVMMKHLEVPAVGGLMVSAQTPDLNRMGFIPDKHYIAVTSANLIEKIKEICRNPRGYEDIRRVGMEFVRKNHGISNRYAKVKEVLDGLLV